MSKHIKMLLKFFGDIFLNKNYKTFCLSKQRGY